MQNIKDFVVHTETKRRDPVLTVRNRQAPQTVMYSLLIVLASVAALGSGELFSSLAHLQTALYTERDIAKEIRHYIYDEQERLQKLSK